MNRRFARFSLFTAVAMLSGLLIGSNAFCTTVTCTGGAITSGTQSTDLVVTGPCTVAAGTYTFQNVNIYATDPTTCTSNPSSCGSLTFSDAPAGIDFYAENIIIENGGSLIAGSPTSPIGSTCTTSSNVTTCGRVTIHLWGAATDPGATCVSSAQCGIPNTLWNSNSYSMSPTTCTQMTLSNGVNDCFYPYMPLRGDTGPAYFGHKVLAVSYGGTLQLFGKKGATYGTPTGCADPTNTASCTGTSWVRLAHDARPGDMSLQVAGTVDWKKGDNIVLTTTDYLPDHSEQLTLSQDAGGATNGATTIGLTSAVQYPHNGQLFDLSTASAHLGANFPTSADMRAAVGLLTRSIQIVSQGDTPTTAFPSAPTSVPGSDKPGYYFGGTTIARQGFTSYQVQGVEFYQLGQGGSLGRYPLHFHMDRQAPSNTFVQDSSVWDSMTRWIVIHATQGMLLARNVGYESIGSGYYLEDGTETGNELYSNLGVSARAAVADNPTTLNPQDPRMVPGILTATDQKCAANPADCPLSYANFPYYLDSDNPSVFWIMNGMNDFQSNMAVGASTCGACYWFVPGSISGSSQMEKWFGYASEQAGAGRAGTTPLQNFVGNSCSTAQEAFIEVGNANPCVGVNQIDQAKRSDLKGANSMLYMLPSPGAPAVTDTTYWPITSGLRIPTRCAAVDSGTSNADCSSVPLCAAGSAEANCDVVVLNKFTTSFNWAETGFAAVWLRPYWTLFVNSVVSDPQNAGINLVTSGGYDISSVIPGYWGLVRQTALIGSSQWENTQAYTDGLASNPYTSNTGPFNPFTATIGSGANSNITGLKCGPDPVSGNANNAYCMSQADAVSFPVANFGGFQRLFSIYDGPIYQDTNAYLNIHPTFFTSNGTVTGAVLETKSGKCKPSDLNGNPCQDAGFSSGGVSGSLAYRDPSDPEKDRCYEPNAAIGWKQPNGFYYAPAFHSRNLFFSGVDIRHFVISPLFRPDKFSFTTDVDATKKAYCHWTSDMFQGFTDIDRETVLNDDDGTLTGLTSPLNPLGPSSVATPTSTAFTTISVNKESFFDAPTEAWECASDYPTSKDKDSKCLPASAKTSPYGYVTTVIYPECASTVPGSTSPAPRFCSGTTPADAWGSVCTTSSPPYGCLGVPIYRQLLKSGESADEPIKQMKRMMGQNNFQRSGLTLNHGWYYIDTTVSIKKQADKGFSSPSSFVGRGVYDLFFLYSKPTTAQTYQMYIGKGLDKTFAQTNVKFGYDGLTLPFVFTAAQASDAASGAWSSRYDPASGILTLKTDMSKIAGIYSLSATIPNSSPAETLGQEYCQPATMCAFTNGNCQCKANGAYSSLCTQTNGSGGPTVCAWSVRDLDCPAQGCPAFQITFPAACTGDNKHGCFVADDSDQRPKPGTFDSADFTYFNVNFNLANENTAGSQCLYTKQPAAVNRCPAVK